MQLNVCKGWMNRDVRCISTDSGHVVDDSHCSPDSKLKSSLFCNHGNCTGRSVTILSIYLYWKKITSLLEDPEILGPHGQLNYES